ncbi:hypothetical protein SASPL_115477 [Salvia splendens]|uniref:Retroviral polymerase SH3-like domain-containing protein n=1 Tax=Salvia splendens TaxID=180675 RepID=A0A8X9A328_SALSN|nr:hypothetical protein SASPL_115477 [Salvia splendens]
MMPEEAWSSFKPSVAHLRVFGCIAYAKIPEARRIKLDDKGEKCIFVGYGDRVMGYKLYNPLTKKMIISRDVVFEEAQTWSWEDKKVASSSEIVPDQQEDAREVEEPDSPTSSQGPVGRPRRMRNLNDIYEVTEEVDEAVEENSCNPVNTPVEISQELRKHDGEAEVDPTYFKSLVGSLRYLTCTRPDILYGVGLISRYMEKPSQSHLNAAKRILRYIKGYDMLWDFCLKQGHVDGFILRIGSFPLELNSCSHRHVSARIDDDFLEGVNGSTIRTIMLYTSDSRRDFRLSIGNVRLLRILDLSNAYHYDFPEEVFELFHLRYLAFHYGFSIWEAISSLVNLQTLIVYPRESDFMIIGNLAEGIWRMPQLRHLSTPKGALEDLQTLSRVVDFVCLRENLKIIPNLKKLALLYTKRWKDYELHNLIYLQKLEILQIEMDWSFVEQQKIMSCAFPPTLKKLSLSNVRLGWDQWRIQEFIFGGASHMINHYITYQK